MPAALEVYDEPGHGHELSGSDATAVSLSETADLVVILVGVGVGWIARRVGRR